MCATSEIKLYNTFNIPVHTSNIEQARRIKILDIIVFVQIVEKGTEFWSTANALEPDYKREGKYSGAKLFRNCMEYEYWCDLIEQIHNGAGFDPETRGGEPNQIWWRPLQGVHVILPRMSKYSNRMKLCNIGIRYFRLIPIYKHKRTTIKLEIK